MGRHAGGAGNKGFANRAKSGQKTVPARLTRVKTEQAARDTRPPPRHPRPPRPKS